MDRKDDFIIRMLERLDEKTDDLLQKHTDAVMKAHDTATLQNSLLAEYNQSLNEHMRRTDLLESRVKPLEDDLELREISKEIRMARLKRTAVVVGILSAAAGAIWSVIQISLQFGWFS